VTDQVVRQQEFRAAHPGVTFEVERTFFLSHRAKWTDPGTGETVSVSSLSLCFLMDELEATFGEVQTPGPKAGGSAVTAC